MEELGEHATSYMSDKVFSCYIKRKNIDIILFTELFTCGSSAQVHSESGDLHSSYDNEHFLLLYGHANSSIHGMYSSCAYTISPKMVTFNDVIIISSPLLR